MLIPLAFAVYRRDIEQPISDPNNDTTLIVRQPVSTDNYSRIEYQFDYGAQASRHETCDNAVMSKFDIASGVG